MTDTICCMNILLSHILGKKTEMFSQVIQWCYTQLPARVIYMVMYPLLGLFLLCLCLSFFSPSGIS